jgi:hypothetical protein
VILYIPGLTARHGTTLCERQRINSNRTCEVCTTRALITSTSAAVCGLLRFFGTQVIVVFETSRTFKSAAGSGTVEYAIALAL